MSKYGCGIKVHSCEISYEILCSKHTLARIKVSQNSPKSTSKGSVILYGPDRWSSWYFTKMLIKQGIVCTADWGRTPLHQAGNVMKYRDCTEMLIKVYLCPLLIKSALYLNVDQSRTALKCFKSGLHWNASNQDCTVMLQIRTALKCFKSGLYCNASNKDCTEMLQIRTALKCFKLGLHWNANQAGNVLHCWSSQDYTKMKGL